MLHTSTALVLVAAVLAVTASATSATVRLDITEFGAVPSGDATQALQRAVDTGCNLIANGSAVGVSVVIPAATFFVGDGKVALRERR